MKNIKAFLRTLDESTRKKIVKGLILDHRILKL